MITLRRRGVVYRFSTPAPSSGEQWAEARPIYLRRALPIPPVARTLRLFERLRSGASFREDVARRLAGNGRFALGASSVDLADAREIEKVHADPLDLYAKLSRVSTDPRDASLRIRFSFGSERLRDWMRDPRRAVAADRFAQAVFPECAAIAANRPLLRRIERLTRARVRFSERILYSNAPGGGAAFHHDAESGQLGVCYGQLAGRTAWLALPKRELAQRAARRLRRPARSVLRALDLGDDRRLERLLNATPDFARELADAGALFLLGPGDALLLPSVGLDDCVWHSVFAAARTPSLALSFAIFSRKKTRPRPV